jgi:putative FmdB family regulatory protein
MFVSSAGSLLRPQALAGDLSELESSMPIFEYRCETCGHKFEAILFGAQTTECPKCHTQKLEQQLSTFAVSKGGTASPAAGCGQPSCCMGKGGCEVN